MAALTMLLNVRASGPGPKICARELAIELGDSSFRPAIVEHLPGVSNVVADRLSRKFAPRKRTRSGEEPAPWKLPAYLIGVTETEVPERTPSYYLTL